MAMIEDGFAPRSSRTYSEWDRARARTSGLTMSRANRPPGARCLSTQARPALTSSLVVRWASELQQRITNGKRRRRSKDRMSPCTNVISTSPASDLAWVARSIAREASSATGQLKDRTACLACEIAIKRLAGSRTNYAVVQGWVIVEG